MHTTHSNTQYKNESSTAKWAQWDKTQSRELLVCSYVCASHCAQLLHTILHRTDPIVFPLTLQTITTARMMSIWGKGVEGSWRIPYFYLYLQASRRETSHPVLRPNYNLTQCTSQCNPVTEGHISGKVPSLFTVQMPFLSPNQQYQTTEWNLKQWK